MNDQELDNKVTAALNVMLHHHDDTCSGVKKEEVATIVKLLHSHMQTAFDDALVEDTHDIEGEYGLKCDGKGDCNCYAGYVNHWYIPTVKKRAAKWLGGSKENG